jgi:hypothetical protein
MSFNSGTPTSESLMSLGQPDHTSGLTGQDGGQPDHAHSQDMTDTRHARDQYDPIDGRPDRDPQPDENIGQTLAVIKEGISNLAAALHSFVSNEVLSATRVCLPVPQNLRSINIGGLHRSPSHRRMTRWISHLKGFALMTTL